MAIVGFVGFVVAALLWCCGVVWVVATSLGAVHLPRVAEGPRGNWSPEGGGGGGCGGAVTNGTAVTVDVMDDAA